MGGLLHGGSGLSGSATGAALSSSDAAAAPSALELSAFGDSVTSDGSVAPIAAPAQPRHAPNAPQRPSMKQQLSRRFSRPLSITAAGSVSPAFGLSPAASGSLASPTPRLSSDAVAPSPFVIDTAAARSAAGAAASSSVGVASPKEQAHVSFAPDVRTGSTGGAEAAAAKPPGPVAEAREGDDGAGGDDAAAQVGSGGGAEGSPDSPSGASLRVIGSVQDVLEAAAADDEGRAGDDGVGAGDEGSDEEGEPDVVSVGLSGRRSAQLERSRSEGVALAGGSPQRAARSGAGTPTVGSATDLASASAGGAAAAAPPPAAGARSMPIKTGSFSRSELTTATSGASSMSSSLGAGPSGGGGGSLMSGVATAPGTLTSMGKSAPSSSMAPPVRAQSLGVKVRRRGGLIGRGGVLCLVGEREE